MKHTAILVDDEDENNLLLSHFLQQYCPEIEVVAVCNSFASAYEQIQKLKPDVLFLDITLGPNEDAFQLVKLLGNFDSKIIFITAHHEFALKAFRHAAIDYLLKPIKIDQLVEAVGKVTQLKKPEEKYKEKLNLLQTILLDKDLMTMTTNKTINIPVEGKIEFWQQKDIMMVEAKLKDTVVTDLNNVKHQTFMSIGDFEEKLARHQFIRIHKSYIVNVEQISSVINKITLTLVLNNGKQLPVSRRKKNEVLSALKIK